MSASNSGEHAGSSAIDWSIFREGEGDDTLAWLWRTGLDEPRTITTTTTTTTPTTGADAAHAMSVDDDGEFSSGSMDAAAARLGSESGSSCGSGSGSDTSSLAASTPAAQGKRPLQRSKPPSARSKRAQNPTRNPVEEEKKQLRRVKNLASVREFRKRKLRQQEENEDRLRRLEAENMDLKMRLKIGKEALVSERVEKAEIKEQMREMLQRGASEHEVAQFVNMYKVTYSDYGPKRREILHFHLARIRELLLPTQVTKLCLYSVEQGREMLASDRDDLGAAAAAGMAPMSLWGILAQELGVSEAQQQQILERREAIKQVQEDLNRTLGIVQQLERVTEDKNTALDAQIAQLQRILTPSQASKFIIWVKENPAFMYMLDKIVEETLMGRPRSEPRSEAGEEKETGNQNQTPQ